LLDFIQNPALNSHLTMAKRRGVRGDIPASIGPMARWLLIATSGILVVAVSIRLVVSWRHYGDLGAPGGIVAAIATDLFDDGTLYRPMISDLGYGGTRYAPLFPVLQAGLMRLGMPVIASGYLISFVATIAIIAAIYALMRRMGAPIALAAGAACLVLCGNCFREEIADIRADTLALALDLWGVVMVVDLADRKKTADSWIRLSLIAAIFALSLAAKITSIFGIVAVVAWLSLRGRRGQALRLAAAWVVAVALLSLATQWASHGRAIAVFRAAAAGGGGINYFMRGPERFFEHLLNNDRAVFCFWILAVSILILERSWKSLPALLLIVTTAGTLLIFGSPGTSINHLLDIQAASILFVGWRLARGGPIHFAVALASALIGIMSVQACCRQIAEIRQDDNRRRLEAVIRDIRQSTVIGPIYAYDTLIPILAGERPYILDGFISRVQRIENPASANKLWDDLAHARFSAVIPHPYRQEWQESSYERDETLLRSHLDRYYLRSEHGSDEVYLPKPR
jgi:Dolichyl-phosphate-mannose-protein mannosyltransferase